MWRIAFSPFFGKECLFCLYIYIYHNMMLKNVIICYHGKQLHILKWAIFGWPDIYRSGILCPKFIIFLFVFVDSMTINLVIIKSLEGNELSSGYVKTLIYEVIKIVQWKSNKIVLTVKVCTTITSQSMTWSFYITLID